MCDRRSADVEPPPHEKANQLMYFLLFSRAFCTRNDIIIYYTHRDVLLSPKYRYTTISQTPTIVTIGNIMDTFNIIIQYLHYIYVFVCVLQLKHVINIKCIRRR